ncbi:hypothetical protein TSUD_74600 [Trifolium subterraneum]|nr:hypothetical protein TSUD_74600 [Trifolium subterraneum]
MCSIGSRDFKFLFFLIILLIFIFLSIPFNVILDAPFPLIQVYSASVNLLTLINNTKLTANWDITLTVIDQDLNNDRLINFHNFSVILFYMDSHLILNKTTLPPFTTDIIRVIHINPSVNRFVVPRVGNLTNHQCGFDVFASIQFKNDIFHFGWKYFNVVCYPLMFANSSSYANNTAIGILLDSLICV